MAGVALEAQGGLQRARAVQVRAQRMVEEALSRVGAAHSQSAQTYQELGVEVEQGTKGSKDNVVQEAVMRAGKGSQIPEWLRVDTLMDMLRAGISWQEVLQRMGFGPGLRLGETPIRVGDPIPRELMLHMEVAFAVQRGYPIRVSIAIPRELEATRVEEVAASSQGLEGQGSETTQEPSCMLLVVFTMAYWPRVLLMQTLSKG